MNLNKMVIVWDKKIYKGVKRSIWFYRALQRHYEIMVREAELCGAD